MGLTLTLDDLLGGKQLAAKGGGVLGGDGRHGLRKEEGHPGACGFGVVW